MTEKYNEVKHQQLGMNASTASARLVKDVLYRLVVEGGKNTCHQCKGEMTRETFSIEHKTPWLHSEDPLGLFFDQSNIAFSHIRCNVAAGRRPTKGTSVCGTASKYVMGCRCAACKESERLRSRKRYTPERRKAQYARTGK